MIKSVVNVRSDQLEDGDVLVVTVAFHVGYKLPDGRPTVRAYRCPWPNPELGQDDGVPQGDNILNEHVEELMKALAPVLTWADAVPDPTN
jgi:hypothetical protein